MKCKVGRHTVICAMLLSGPAAPAEVIKTCSWSDGFGLLFATISSSSGFASVAGRYAFMETLSCKNPPCLSEQRQTLLQAIVDEQRRVFDRATQSTILVGQGVFGGRIVSLEVTESTSNFKMTFPDGSQTTFTFGGCP